MDVPISSVVKRQRQKRRWLLGSVMVVVLTLVTLGLSRLKPAAPRVEKSSVWLDTVRRGEMLRQVRGNGTLVPEDIRWIPTINQGRVERILVLPGERVKADTVLVELSNPSLEQDVFEAESQLKEAGEELSSLREKIKNQPENSDTPSRLLPSEATVMALGIHVDTGSLTFEGATSRDASALAWLMEQGSSLRVIAEYVEPGLSPQLQDLLPEALKNLRSEEARISSILIPWISNA